MGRVKEVILEQMVGNGIDGQAIDRVITKLRSRKQTVNVSGKTFSNHWRWKLV